MTLQEHEYEAFLQLAGIQPEEVAKFHSAWGVRNSKGKWNGTLLVELARGRGPRGGKRGKNRFALVGVYDERAWAQWNTELSHGWRRTVYLEGDELVLAPERPAPPDRRAAIAATKAKARARALGLRD